MAHTKSGGSTNLGRDSQSKRLGVKVHDGVLARPGQIIIRQRGTKFHPGQNVARGADDTLYAMAQGVVRFEKRRHWTVRGGNVRRAVVSVIPTPSAGA